MAEADRLRSLQAFFPGSTLADLSAMASRPPDTSPVMYRTASPLVNITQRDLDVGQNLAMGFAGGGLATKPLAIKDAVEAAAVAPDMVRLYRGGGNNPGGPKWVTTDRRYAERYTTPGLAHTPGAGSFLQFVDVPATDPRVQIPAGQKVQSFEAPSEIADLLRPFYGPKP